MDRTAPRLPRAASHVAAALALLLAVALAPTHASAQPDEDRDADRGPQVRVRIVSVRATGTHAAGRPPAVDPNLDSLRMPWAKLPFQFGRYERASNLDRRVRWGERLELKYAGDGTYAVTPSPGTDAQPIGLSVSQTLPGQTEPCLTARVDLAEDQKVPLFCSTGTEGATYVFVVSGSLEKKRD